MLWTLKIFCTFWRNGSVSRRSCKSSQKQDKTSSQAGADYHRIYTYCDCQYYYWASWSPGVPSFSSRDGHFARSRTGCLLGFLFPSSAASKFLILVPLKLPSTTSKLFLETPSVSNHCHSFPGPSCHAPDHRTACRIHNSSRAHLVCVQNRQSSHQDFASLS